MLEFNILFDISYVWGTPIKQVINDILDIFRFHHIHLQKKQRIFLNDSRIKAIAQVFLKIWLHLFNGWQWEYLEWQIQNLAFLRNSQTCITLKRRYLLSYIDFILQTYLHLHLQIHPIHQGHLPYWYWQVGHSHCWNSTRLLSSQL